MDASNSNALTPEAFLGGTPSFRTDLYATCGTLLTHAESIELFQELGSEDDAGAQGPRRAHAIQDPVSQVSFSQDDYRQKPINEYKAAGVHPRNVYAQSFNLDDVRYSIEHEPRFGKQAVYLNDRFDSHVQI